MIASVRGFASARPGPLDQFDDRSVGVPEVDDGRAFKCDCIGYRRRLSVRVVSGLGQSPQDFRDIVHSKGHVRAASGVGALQNVVSAAGAIVAVNPGAGTGPLAEANPRSAAELGPETSGDHPASHATHSQRARGWRRGQPAAVGWLPHARRPVRRVEPVISSIANRGPAMCRHRPRPGCTRSSPHRPQGQHRKPAHAPRPGPRAEPTGRGTMTAPDRTLGLARPAPARGEAAQATAAACASIGCRGITKCESACKDAKCLIAGALLAVVTLAQLGPQRISG
jgi:hypothetical protein